MSDREPCPFCCETLVFNHPGDFCSKCGATIVERSSHSAASNEEDNVLDGDRVAVHAERY